MALLFSNNASAELAAALTADATTLYVEEGKGSYFPVISRVGDYFYVTLVGDSVIEIVKVTATEGDTFTVVRAQDDTEAAAFAIGDLIELRITAADFKDILTSPKLSDFFADSSKVNPIYSTDADTYQYWSSIRGGVYYYNRAGSLVNQPSQYGLLLHCAQLAFVFQLWKALPNGDLYYRSMSDTNERDEWTKLAKDADLTALAEQINTDITTSINNLDTKIDTVSTNATTGINEAKAAAASSKPAAGTGISVGTSTDTGTPVSLATYGTAGNYGSSSNQTPGFNSTFNIPYVSTDAYGRVTAATTTVKIPALPAAASSPKAYLSATYSSGTSWYRKWSDGWIEQGGVSAVISDGSTSITFPTQFSNTNYTILSIARHPTSNSSITTVRDLTTTTVTLTFDVEDGSGSSAVQWYACGF